MLSAILSMERSYVALLTSKQPRHQRFPLPGPLVLRSASFNLLTPTVDRDRTVSRRSKPSSRTTLMGEQPNPWNLFQLQDVMSRHRGAKRSRQYELSRIISLLSPAYLLSVKRWLFHTKIIGSLGPTKCKATFSSCSTCLSYNQASIYPCAPQPSYPAWAYLRAPPLLFGRRPPQSN